MQQPSTFIPQLQGLRAIAVIAVVLYHCAPHVLPGSYVGVDVFFVLSGYLIYGLLVQRISKSSQQTQEARYVGSVTVIRLWGQFIAARIRRLTPALALVLICTWVLGYRLLGPTDFALLGQNMTASTAWATHLWAAINTQYFAPAARSQPLLHLWSLGIEFQFYLLAPVFVLILMYFTARLQVRMSRALLLMLMIGSVMLIAVSAWMSSVLRLPTQADAQFYMLHLRLWEPLAGILLAHMLRHPPRLSTSMYRLVSLSTIALLTCALGDAGRWVWPQWHTWVNTVLAVCATLGLLALVPSNSDSEPHTSSWLNKLLSHPVAVSIGHVSYPWYLWHWPLLAFAWIAPPQMTWWPQAGPWVIGIGSLGLAYVTYYLVERPLGAIKPASAASSLAASHQRPLVYLSIIMLITLGALGWFTHQQGGFAQRFSHTQVELAQLKRVSTPAMREQQCFLQPEQPIQTYPPQCVDAQPHQATLVALWGDSHAAHMLPGLRAALGTQVRLAQWTASACPPLLGYVSTIHPQCAQLNQSTLKQIAQQRPAVLVLMARWEQYPSAINGQQLAQTLAQVKPLAQRIIVIGPTPAWQPHLPGVLLNLSRSQSSAGHAIPNRITIGLDPTPFTVAPQIRLTTLQAGATNFDPLDHLCNVAGCLVTVGQGTQLMTHDYGHLTESAATWLAQRLVQHSQLP